MRLDRHQSGKRPGHVRINRIVDFAENLQSFAYLSFGLLVFGFMVHAVVRSAIGAWAEGQWSIVAVEVCGITVTLAVIGFDAYRRRVSWPTGGFLLVWFLLTVISLGVRTFPL